MDKIEISSEQFQQALGWINGQASTLGEKEVLAMLRSLNDGFRENCRRLRPGPIPRFRSLSLHPLSLTALMQDMDIGAEGTEPPQQAAPAIEQPRVVAAPETPPVSLTPEMKVMKEVGRQSELDSVLLINSIAHVGAMAGYPVSQSRAQIILYCLYGSRLGAGMERLAIEHPQMWRYGPVFPRAYKRGSIGDRTACADSYRELMDREPVLLTALSTKTQSMMATPMADLNAVHKGARSPYGRMVARYPDKWGTQIPDEEIAEFFRSRMTG